MNQPTQQQPWLSQHTVSRLPLSRRALRNARNVRKLGAAVTGVVASVALGLVLLPSPRPSTWPLAVALFAASGAVTLGAWACGWWIKRQGEYLHYIYAQPLDRVDHLRDSIDNLARRFLDYSPISFTLPQEREAWQDATIQLANQLGGSITGPKSGGSRDTLITNWPWSVGWVVGHRLGQKWPVVLWEREDHRPRTKEGPAIDLQNLPEPDHTLVRAIEENTETSRDAENLVIFLEFTRELDADLLPDRIARYPRIRLQHAELDGPPVENTHIPLDQHADLVSTTAAHLGDLLGQANQIHLAATLPPTWSYALGALASLLPEEPEIRFLDYDGSRLVPTDLVTPRRAPVPHLFGPSTAAADMPAG